MGLTQTDVAKILGLKSTSPISRWEHGVRLPETISALKLSILYDASVDDIYEDLRLDLVDELSPRTDRVLQRDAVRRYD